MSRKKKLSLKLKVWNIILIVLLSLFTLFLLIFLIKVLFKKEAFYEIVPRDENISKSRKVDEDSYETIGWVRVQGTNIDYPLYGVLKEAFDYPVTESYLWSLNMDSKFHNVLIVYGHNIMNLGPKPSMHDDNFTRLEELMSYVYYDHAKENKYIQLSMDGKDRVYEIFAINFMPVYDLNEYPEGEFTTEDKNNYIDRLRKESIYDYDVNVEDDDNIISVVTCSRFFGDGKSYDFIVSGREVKDTKKLENYKVSRNKNYEIVDKMLKGDDEYEETKNA